VPVRINVRPACLEDISAVATILREYMAEAFGRSWEGSTDALKRDGLGGEFHTLVAELSGCIIAFACWRRVYDVHHCAAGAEVTDMFVRPDHRGRALAVRLLAAVAAQAQAAGGCFLKGRSDAKVEALYRRVAVLSPGADCYVGNRAFRVLANLTEASPRTLLRGLPDVSFNYQQ